ncbi:hypothetical protein HNY73_017570 [Argiope bruennichi]|uniref:Uncharacterized protein n=1 Tax=Argiope bruennichi TaxID=94029 RepID=A0A8T0EA43_ARGBR|nr:hypothetical protein HNY73_017570 [Argiope bruennichi]
MPKAKSSKTGRRTKPSVTKRTISAKLSALKMLVKAPGILRPSTPPSADRLRSEEEQQHLRPMQGPLPLKARSCITSQALR